MADIRSMFMKMGSKPKDKEKAGDDDAGGADKKVSHWHPQPVQLSRQRIHAPTADPRSSEERPRCISASRSRNIHHRNASSSLGALRWKRSQLGRRLPARDRSARRTPRRRRSRRGWSNPPSLAARPNLTAAARRRLASARPPGTTLSTMRIYPFFRNYPSAVSLGLIWRTILQLTFSVSKSVPFGPGVTPGAQL